jgi:hypothetical protein
VRIRVATREQNLRSAAFYAGILEQSIADIERHYNSKNGLNGLSPLAVGNLRRRFDDMNYYLRDAMKHAKKARRRR